MVTGFQRCDLGLCGMFVCQGMAVGNSAQTPVYLDRRERMPEKDILSCQVVLFVIVQHVSDYDLCLISILEYQHSVKAMSSMSSGNRQACF